MYVLSPPLCDGKPDSSVNTLVNLVEGTDFELSSFKHTHSHTLPHRPTGRLTDAAAMMAVFSLDQADWLVGNAVTTQTHKLFFLLKTSTAT